MEKLEELNDFLDQRIESALLELSQRELTPQQALRVVQLVRVSNGIEQLGDTGASIGRLVDAARQTGVSLSRDALRDLQEVEEALGRSFEPLIEDFPTLTTEQAAAHRASQAALRGLINTKYARHLDRLSQEKSYSPGFVVESLSGIESASSQLREIRKQLENPVEVVR